jgi:hypothetical protein
VLVAHAFGWERGDWVADVHDAEVLAPVGGLGVDVVDVFFVADAGGAEGDLSGCQYFMLLRRCSEQSYQIRDNSTLSKFRRGICSDGTTEGVTDGQSSVSRIVILSVLYFSFDVRCYSLPEVVETGNDLAVLAEVIVGWHEIKKGDEVGKGFDTAECGHNEPICMVYGNEAASISPCSTDDSQL